MSRTTRTGVSELSEGRSAIIRRVLLGLSLCALVSITWAGASSAALIDEGDWLLDTTTDLQWLDLRIPQINPDGTPTDPWNSAVGYTVTEILAGAGGFTAEGWRYATAPELCGLFGTYASITTCPGSETQSDAHATGLGTLVSALGVTWANAEESVTGFFDDGELLDGIGIAGLYVTAYGFEPESGGTSVRFNQGDASAPNENDFLLGAPISHFLVRSVPEPGTGLLLGLGLVVLSHRRTARRRAAPCA